MHSLTGCLQKIHEILPGAQDPESALEHAMERCRWTKTAADAVSAAQRQLEVLQAAVGTLSDTPQLISPSTATGPSAAPLRQMHSQLQQLTSILAQHHGPRSRHWRSRHADGTARAAARAAFQTGI